MILSFDKPKKILSTKEHNDKYSSDSGVAGTYVSNMSDVDKQKFKAKHIKGEDERIEIRVTLGVNVVIIVYKDIRYKEWSKCKDRNEFYKNHNNIKFSMNGKLDIDFHQFNQIQQAISEAKNILFNNE